MPFIKFKTDEDKIIFVNLNQITYIEEEDYNSTIWLSDGNGFRTSTSLNEILRLIKEAENGK